MTMGKATLRRTKGNPDGVTEEKLLEEAVNMSRLEQNLTGKNAPGRPVHLTASAKASVFDKMGSSLNKPNKKAAGRIEAKKSVRDALSNALIGEAAMRDRNNVFSQKNQTSPSLRSMYDATSRGATSAMIPRTNA